MSRPQLKYGPAKGMEFYNKNSVVFLTGATGFVGKTILEKLLRSFPQITKIYLLVRVSADKTLQGRIENLFSNSIFDTLKSQFSSGQEFQEMVVNKIIPVQGDISVNHLGLSDKDMAMVQEDATVFINSAASVGWSDPLDIALEMNTNGPFRIFDVAKGCKNLAAIVHISTIFVNSPMVDQHVNETIYPHPLGDDPEAIYEMLATKMSYDEIKHYEKSVVLKTYPNTYTFAKSLTEHLIKKRYKDMALPIVIVRPSGVGATHREPVPGWVEGANASNKVIISCALGQVQEWIGCESVITDLIPVDIVAKTALLSATTADRTLTEPPIYQVGTSCISPLTWRTFGTNMVAYWRAADPPLRRVSDDIRFELYSPSEFKHRFNSRFGEQLRILAQHKGHERIKALISKAVAVPTIFKAFGLYQWFFDATNTLALDDGAPAELKSDLRGGIDWNKYMENYNAGVQVFILGEKVGRPIAIKHLNKSHSEMSTKSERRPESTTTIETSAKL
ncbi:cyclin-dependent kinase inhibitor far1 [Lobosporangium transversale]|uniref:Fatty acyl-CoA reductase n=1 Tax=Lobosporangium transversale TaxID=64571 RepID=A0A1Y2G998_9FUNG|nr:male sterility protein-domain-containing protein [Lobosporangium transversale]KAF9913384.1 cyclin-dependent kinase inhibitor far1 [Lobosporangium transversale]ORZ04702.1 male sterility protein-domain-containing protein [Lobosporangium transversale]|eukprot:XP_021876699.1 male sterility protein-domain-containing protein [Lobosporangium transversale]